jgi:hypothetical protein
VLGQSRSFSDIMYGVLAQSRSFSEINSQLGDLRWPEGWIGRGILSHSTSVRLYGWQLGGERLLYSAENEIFELFTELRHTVLCSLLIGASCVQHHAVRHPVYPHLHHQG